MAGGAQWQRLEAYGLMEADAGGVHGDNWHKARDAVSATLGEQLPADALETELAAARVQLGQYDQAERILRNLPEVHDVREGKTAPADLWLELHARRIARSENIPLDNALRRRVQREFPPPGSIDARMHAPDDGK